MTQPDQKPTDAKGSVAWLWSHIKQWALAGWIAVVVAVFTLSTNIWSAITYISEAPLRKQVAINAAWGTLADMEGKRGDGGRLQALKLLKNNNVSLAGAVFDNAFFRSVDLGGAHLAKASFRRAELAKCDFRKADLSDSVFEFTVCAERCDFRGALMDGANVKSAVFADCMFANTSLHRLEADSKTSFNGTILTGCVISNAKCEGTVFDGAEMRDVRIVGGDLSAASFQRAIASRWHWVGVNATGAKLQLANGNDCEFSDNTILSMGRFDRCVLKNAKFENVKIDRATFYAADLTGCVFVACDLSRCDFSSATLESVFFQNCKIDGADFTQVRGLGVNAFSNCTGTAKGEGGNQIND
jgi:uncharacterized protein YjbI with pentapeptide repeats